MKLSIIVPVYNMAADGKLEYCMDSLLAQRVSPFEVIAVDDCSTDDSLTILREYEKKYPKIVKVIASDVNRIVGSYPTLTSIYYIPIVQWSRTPAFHVGNTSSNLVRNTTTH